MTEYPWTTETMRIINELTPSITGKAYDPEWFLLRQRFEAFESGRATTFWVVERFEQGKSVGYFDGGNIFRGFSSHIDHALQFKRQKDAERVAEFMYGDVRATEHGYLEERKG